MRAKRHRLELLVAIHLTALCTATSAAQVRSAAFACDSGPYAVVLPQHYPTLHVIGKHKWTDLESRSTGAAALTTRKIEYIGMTAEVSLSSSAPNTYRLLALEVSSRRWNVGPLSVGQNPWRTVKDPALEGIAQDGTLEVIGTRDSALLQLNRPGFRGGSNS
jgi:hypothetical protein